MRTVDISINGGKIHKTYLAPTEFGQQFNSHLAAYKAWVIGLGFTDPNTQVAQQGNDIVINQNYIRGTEPTATHWQEVCDVIVGLPLNMPYGLDANPLNFIFTGTEIYFIDYYPLLVSDAAYVAQQFSYEYSEVKARYYFAPSVLICFLNRLRKIDKQAFEKLRDTYSPYLSDNAGGLLPRDTYRFAMASKLNDADYQAMYTASKKMSSDNAPQATN